MSVISQGPRERVIQDHITREAMEQMVEQLVGLPVTIDFDRERVVGEVTAARADDVGIQVTMAINDVDVRGRL